MFACSNKYNLNQSLLHTASETLVHHKKIQIRLEFLQFYIRRLASISKGKDDEYKKMHTKKTMQLPLQSFRSMDGGVYNTNVPKVIASFSLNTIFSRNLIC